MHLPYEPGYHPDDLVVHISELLVATADASDELVDQSISEVLRLLRDKMKMDVGFVSEFNGGQRVMRFVETSPGSPAAAVGDADLLEVSWCQRMVDGRLPNYIADAGQLPASAELLKNLPFSIGTHISTPIVLRGGKVYGALCTFSMAPKDNPDSNHLKALRYTAKLAAEKIEGRREQHKRRPPAADLSLVPRDKEPPSI